MSRMPPNEDRSSGTRIAPMELEVFQPMLIRQSASNGRRMASDRGHPIDDFVIMVRLYIEYYPRLSSLLVIMFLCFGIYMLAYQIRKPVTRNRLSHDYTKIDLHYNWKSSQIDHWCLWGGDDSCHCDDFSEPMSREEKKGWLQSHHANVEKIDLSRQYDVVFYGDEMMQSWTGKWLNMPMITPDGARIARIWNQTFTKAGGGDFEGLALGIMGDVAPNVLWRLQNDEMPAQLKARVFWILIGTNDLARGGCSEEVVLLGILRLADEIHYQHPDAVVVIQGILPRTSSKDGTLEEKNAPLISKLIHPASGDTERAHSALEAFSRFQLWPSILNINQQLASFCEKHEHLVYFDANDLFLGSMGNEHYRAKGKTIISDLMPDMIHPSFDGYRIMAKVIKEELGRIIHEHNEANDIETQGRA